METAGLQDQSILVCSLFQNNAIIKKSFRVNISYQFAGTNQRGFDVTESTIVKTLLEQYLKATYGTQYQPFFLSRFSLSFNGQVLNSNKSVGQCGIRKATELIASQTNVNIAVIPSTGPIHSGHSGTVIRPKKRSGVRRIQSEVNYTPQITIIHVRNGKKRSFKKEITADTITRNVNVVALIVV